METIIYTIYVHNILIYLYRVHPPLKQINITGDGSEPHHPFSSLWQWVFFVQVKIPSVFGSDWETKPEVSSTSEWRFIQLNFRFLNF